MTRATHTPKDDEQGFDAWYAKVDAAVQAKTGLSVDDLPDCCYRDWWEDGMTAGQAARAAIRSAQEG
jgi:hypothetical protein